MISNFWKLSKPSKATSNPIVFIFVKQDFQLLLDMFLEVSLHDVMALDFMHSWRICSFTDFGKTKAGRKLTQPKNISDFFLAGTIPYDVVPQVFAVQMYLRFLQVSR